MYNKCVKNWFKILNRLPKNVRKPQAAGGGGIFLSHTVLGQAYIPFCLSIPVSESADVSSFLDSLSELYITQYYTHCIFQLGLFRPNDKMDLCDRWCDLYELH